MTTTLQTKRLQLCPINMEDFAFLHAAFTNDFVKKHLWDDMTISKEETFAIINESMERFSKEKWGLWKLTEKANDTSIGFVGLWNFFEEPQPQLLVGLLPEHTQKGFALESCRQIINYTFEKLKFPYLIAATDFDNLSSQKLIRNLGMKKVNQRIIDGQLTSFYRLENASLISG